MNHLIKAVSALFILALFSGAYAQDKVVVVPMPADSVNKGLVPVAVASVDSVGGITQGYGVTSVSNAAVGTYDVTLDSQINPSNPIVLITPFTIGFGSPEITGYEPFDSHNFRIIIQKADGTAKDSAFSFAVYHIQ